MSKDKNQIIVERVVAFFEIHAVMSLEDWNELLFAVDAEIPE